jgi:hypothetical protein
MDTNIPYMPSVKNLPLILAKIQSAGVPQAFGYDFLRDLGFTSSNDRSVVKVLKYIGFLDSSGIPQTAYRNFTDQTQSKRILADSLRKAFDDLFLAHPSAPSKTSEDLKGWFKSKTGESDAVAQKIASTFKALAVAADFSASSDAAPTPPEPPQMVNPGVKPADTPSVPLVPATRPELGLVYRIEIHLPDTQNIETYRSIFRALREELAR